MGSAVWKSPLTRYAPTKTTGAVASCATAAAQPYCLACTMCMQALLEQPLVLSSIHLCMQTGAQKGALCCNLRPAAYALEDRYRMPLTTPQLAVHKLSFMHPVA